MRKPGNGKLTAFDRRQLEKFRQCLLQRQEELRQMLAGRLENLTSAPGGVRGELADAALDFGIQEMSCLSVEIAGQELALIERALQKIAQGCYGRCENCGRKIAIARLQALPHALYCIACQRLLENSGASDDKLDARWERVFEMEQAEREPGPDLTELEADIQS